VIQRPNSRASLVATACLLVGVECLSPPPRAVQQNRAAQAAVDGPAMLVVDLPSGHIHSTLRPDLIHARLAPGSVLKIATLITALESGVVSSSTRFTCHRRVNVAGRELDCVHPDLGRPMSPAEALALSCNDFFTTIAQRISRGALGATTAALGLPAIEAGARMPLAGIGLEGIEASPEELLKALLRVADPDSGLLLKRETRQVLIEGLRGAAGYGTAHAIGDRGIDALAKTGTAPMPGGGYYGLIVAVAPSIRPSHGVVVLVPGGSGADAAEIAAETLAQLIQGTRRGDRSGIRGMAGARRDQAAAPLKTSGVGSAASAPRQDAAVLRQDQGGTLIRVGRARTGGYDVVEVPLEQYVARVVAAEEAPGSEPAALEALAIAARTFALANLGRHASENFDLCDLTHCQVMGTATPSTEQAAGATAGQVLVYRGRPASVFYSACCGGESERPSDVWPGAQDVPYLVRHEDPECRDLPEWTSEIRADDLLQALRAAGFRGDRVLNLSVARRSPSGRAALLRVDGLTPGEITGEDLRLALGRTLGWQLVKSTAFALARTSTGYRFTGLCIVGSARMAAEGRSAAEILAEYFPGTTIGSVGDLTLSWSGAGGQGPRELAQPGLRVGQPAVPRARSSRQEQEVASASDVRVDVQASLDSQQMRGSVISLVRRTLDEFAGKLGVGLPGQVLLVFHPTVESYSRQTSQPWWTAGATNGRRVDLLPLPVLQERRILEKTLRHEIAHVLTASRLSGRPLWVQEGAAIWLSGEHVEPPRATGTAPGGACPTDSELGRSRSAAALQDAYARAAACYVAQIREGKRWDQVR
jgi:SpoIID/LytB domain protein